MSGRRRYLKTIVAGMTATVAGCSGTDDESETEPTTGTDAEPTATDSTETATESDTETGTDVENPFEPPTEGEEGPEGPPGPPGTPQETTETETPTEEG